MLHLLFALGSAGSPPTRDAAASAAPSATPQPLTALSAIIHSPPAEPAEPPPRGLTFALTVALVLLIAGAVALYLYYQKRAEEDQNPEYTRAILGDDAFEFSKMDTF
jgi:H+/Cl- antiporter ClcA